MSKVIPTLGNSPARRNVLVMGDYEHPDFAGTLHQLKTSALCHSAGRDDLADRSPDSPPTDLAVVFLARPRVDAPSYHEALQEQLGGAEVVCVLGSWCVGQRWKLGGRLADKCLYDHEFLVWWHRHCLDSCSPASETGSQSGSLAVVDTRHRANFEAISDSLEPSGWSGIWQPNEGVGACYQNAGVGIWDRGELTETEAGRLAQFSRPFINRNLPVVVLLDFPQPAQIAEAKKSGATIVLGKPWLSEDLVSSCEGFKQLDSHGESMAA